MMFWAVGAASMSGFAITALFVIVEIGQFVKRAAQRNALKRYASGLVSLGFLCLLIARACYLARVLFEAETPPNILLSSADSGGFRHALAGNGGQLFLCPGRECLDLWFATLMMRSKADIGRPARTRTGAINLSCERLYSRR